MKHFINILIFALALVGLITLIVHLHWFGAIGVACLVIKEIKPASEEADKVIEQIQTIWEKWKNNKKERKNE